MSDLDDRDDELLNALRRLPREMTPPSLVAARLVTALPGRFQRRAMWQLAVAASLVVAAFAAGRVSAPSAVNAPAGGQKFAFLLYGGTPGGGDDRAAEYGKWALELRRAGRQVTGERLADTAWTAGSSVSDPLPLRGFFIIEAQDSREALDLARRHPHAQDGTIIIRQIDTP